MKKFLAVFLFAALVVSTSFAQDSKINPYVDSYRPSTSYAGTLMNLRSVTNAYDDTTKAILTQGMAAVYVVLETSANDSARVLVSYAPSEDGVNFKAFVAVDSLTTTGTVGVLKSIPLPSAALGFYAVKVRVNANSDILRYSADPTTKLTTRIKRVPHTIYKVK